MNERLYCRVYPSIRQTQEKGQDFNFRLKSGPGVLTWMEAVLQVISVNVQLVSGPREHFIRNRY